MKTYYLQKLKPKPTMTGIKDLQMKITAVETINLQEYPNLLWIKIYTDEGLIGLGETFYGVSPVIAMYMKLVLPISSEKIPLK